MTSYLLTLVVRLISWCQSHPNTFFSFQSKWYFLELYWYLSILSNVKGEVQKQIIQNCFDFHDSKTRTNAVSWTNSKWNISVWIYFATIFNTETFRIELLRIWKVLRITMEAPNWYEKAHVFFKQESLVIVLQFVIFNIDSINNLF